MPDAVRAALVEHARAAAPNEAAGHVVFRDGVAVRYEPGIMQAATEFYFQVVPRDPELLFLEDEGFELGLFHSHVTAPARPSRTDVENARDLWPARPYLIYSLREDDLAAFAIGEDGRISELPLG